MEEERHAEYLARKREHVRECLSSQVPQRVGKYFIHSENTCMVACTNTDELRCVCMCVYRWTETV